MVIKHDVLKRFLAARTIIILAAIVQVNFSSAQNLQFRSYSTDEGFTGASFKKLAQDSLGFLWIASASGLYKFDGYNFTNYKPIQNDSLSLPQEMVNHVWVDPHGRVWAGFVDRISCYDRDIDGFVSYKVSSDGTGPESIWFENEDVLWLGAPGSGLIQFTISKKESIIYTNTSGDKSMNESRNSIREIKDDGEYLLLGTANGLWRFDKQKKSFERPLCTSQDSVLFYAGDVRKIIRHRDHNWIWVNRQLVKVTKNLKVVNSLNLDLIKQRFDVNQRYEDAGVVSIEEGPNGMFWVASQGLGLTLFNPENNELTNFRSDKDDNNSLPADVLCDLLVDFNKNIWLATLTKGIAHVKQQSLRFINDLPGISTSRMIILHTPHADRLIVASQGNGLWMSELDQRSTHPFSFKKFEPHGASEGFNGLTGVYTGKNNIWVGSLTSGAMGIAINDGDIIKNHPVKIFQNNPNNPNTISSNVIIGAMLEDNKGNLFVGTRSGGLNKILLSAEYGGDGSVTRYQHDENDSTSIVDNGVIDLKHQNDGSLLVATQSGLDIMREGRFEHIFKNMACTRVLLTADETIIVGTKNGLYEGEKKSDRYVFTKADVPGSPFITALREDSLGRIWCMTYEGLLFYDREKKLSLIFKKEDGLPSSRSISGSGSAYAPNGKMIFSNAEGLTSFDPLSLQVNRAKPKPVITQLKINNKAVHSTKRNVGDKDFVIPRSINTLNELTLDYTQNIITLEFSALDHTAPERNLYSYQLVNFDKDSVLTDWKNRTATYTNLRPGDYTFIVKASNRDGIWNDHQTELIIHVLPPPWKTWWAYSLYGIAIAGLLFLARRNIIKQERLTSKLALEHVELEKVQEIDKAKTNFFANISHEFRTPLTLIQGPVQNLMEKFKTDTQVKDQLMLVQQNSDRLLRLVNQILELARLESGTLKNEMSESDIILFLKKIVGSFTSFAFQKKISFIQQFPDYGIRAQFDKDKLEKITSNLISNALKFTPEQGAVIVNVSVTRSNGSGELLLKVTDTGKGVSEDQMTKIFERFYQVSEDGNINVGSGIGLALCKELAEFLGGSLKLESKVGEGSRFSLALPLETAEVISEIQIDESVAILSNHHEVTPTVVTENADQVEKPLVLIVEDHADLRKFIISCLGTEYTFLEASNGKEGFHHAIEQVPTLVLSDVMMPEMDGIEMCNKIKQDQRTSHIPVILLTAKASDESKLSGLGIGADDYIIKPFNKDELKLKIRNQVAARTRMQERIRMEFLSESTTIRAVSADEKFLERLKKIVETRIGDEHLSVESLTEEIGMSRAQLYRKVTALTGLSGNEFIRKLRLQRAAQLLQQRVGPVSQVAYEVGFSNLSYFSKCFKEQFGVLPSEYTARVS